MSEVSSVLAVNDTRKVAESVKEAAVPAQSPRPGRRLGDYPQRDIEPESALAALASHWTRYRMCRQYGLNNTRQEFIDRVDFAGELLIKKSDAELDMFRQQLQAQLKRLGLLDSLVAQTFALVREQARRTLGKRHYDVQLVGGWYLVRGILAEMETGEGKTLTATLAASTAALAGIPVHVITVNDYLAQRDAKAMGPLYRALGLSVGVVTAETEPAERQAAYECQIAYCTNKQLVFDYLRDRVAMANDGAGLVTRLKGLHQGQGASAQTFLRGLCFGIVDEADSVLIDEARTPLILSRPGDNRMQTEVCRIALKMAAKMKRDRHFVLNNREGRVKLTDHGRLRLQEAAKRLGGAWKGRQRREDWLSQALSALHLFMKDKHYLVRNGKVEIIDEFTGRTLPDRAWERGLQQMIEYKEGCDISAGQETLARISYQRFFRRYLHLCGMSGTAREVAGELWSVYRLPVVAVPTHQPSQLKQLPDLVYRHEHQKWRAVIEAVRNESQAGRPVLVGTRSVATSETLAAKLKQAGLPYQVLNARQDAQEAQVIARAGQSGQVTVATNMAGRGTDILLSKGVVYQGGLHVIATERHDARRIDRQLFGRSARQGAPGSCQAILSMDDELPIQHLPAALVRFGKKLPRQLRQLIMRLAQYRAQRHHRAIRAELLKHDEQLEDLLAFSGKSE